MNHDGARRRANLNAILMAAEATYDLAERVKAAVADPALWALVVRPGQDWYANGAWDRAQAMSMAAGQWGFEHSESVTQVLIAFNGSMGPTSPSFFFDIAWQRALFLFWAAAPTAHATGGGANPFPPNAAPLFGLPAPTVAGMPAFIGRYSVLWGGRRAELDLTPRPPHPVGATLLLDGKLYKQERMRRCRRERCGSTSTRDRAHVHESGRALPDRSFARPRGVLAGCHRRPGRLRRHEERDARRDAAGAPLDHRALRRAPHGSARVRSSVLYFFLYCSWHPRHAAFAASRSAARAALAPSFEIETQFA